MRQSRNILQGCQQAALLSKPFLRGPASSLVVESTVRRYLFSLRQLNKGCQQSRLSVPPQSDGRSQNWALTPQFQHKHSTVQSGSRRDISTQDLEKIKYPALTSKHRLQRAPHIQWNVRFWTSVTVQPCASSAYLLACNCLALDQLKPARLAAGSAGRTSGSAQPLQRQPAVIWSRCWSFTRLGTSGRSPAPLTSLG